MTAVGITSLGLFMAGIVGSVRGWIPQRVLTLQTVLLLVASVSLLLAVLAGAPVSWSQIPGSMALHPITATIAGFLLAGALQAAGAFDAASRLIAGVTRTPLGLPFAAAVLVNLPAVFAMPCGRILAAPLMPLAISLGWAAVKDDDRGPVAMTVFGLTVNAAASCAPSLIGGIGLVGEGMGRYPAGSFSNAAQLGIVVTTVATMALIRLVYRDSLRIRAPRPAVATDRPVPEHGYLALALFVALLLVVVLVRPPIPLQTMLVVATLAVMAMARLRLSDLMSGVMLHPLSAMLAGFVVAGALGAAGAFEILEAVLVWTAEHTFLGYVGVGVVLVFLPLMFAMPCGRILAVSLIPGVLLFGERLAQATGAPLAAPVLLSSFILSGAASCGPSPLGGIGNIGEGRLRIRGFWSGRPQALGVLVGVPVSGLLLSRLGLGDAGLDAGYAWAALGVGLAAGAAINLLYGHKAYHPGGLLGGVLTGALMAVL